MSCCGNNFPRRNVQRYGQSLTVEHPKSIRKACAKSFVLGPASSVQKAVQSLDSRDILDRYKGNYFFLDPLFLCWIRRKRA